ncbi:Coatomer subunit beta [Caenorhabditis elegans]|uniref:Coatomer subunit beta n=1 Tax=Caenorhabditis elegans TaxID=6239 RepID=Q9TYL9_CAEEL|nr:Coatomer subunit beta [Caenorhabditis elegans]CCD61981.1 Coatomer subunit beta [Caenorhabditis elegans]|eukprot:NP_494441.1 Coatomer subunit beta [Caenorhabditis elegans]
MSSGEQPCYTLIHVPSDAELPSEAQLKEKFEKGGDKERIEALKKLIYMILNGEKTSQSMLMYVIRFCLPSNEHTLKKVLLIFWECVPKTDSNGKLLHEMILVCDAYRKDLQHPNEFVRGSTLRFLCKLREPELLEPLMPAIRACLEHRHSYVRRNAVCAIFTIYKNFEFLIPDAPELVTEYLEQEQDASCKRNAFMMLLHVDQARALDYLSGCIDQVGSFGDILQLVIVELIYKVCHNNPNEASRFIRCVYNLLQSSSPAVRYEAAGTLVTLSNVPAAVKAAASAYIDLIVKESDNNVKLIVLDRLVALRGSSSNEKILQGLVMDILRVLSSPGLEVRKKTLSLALDLVSSRNVEDMVMFLKKEINKTATESNDENGKYRQELVKTLHAATIKFPDVASTIVPVLMEFLSDTNEKASSYVLQFVREAVHKLPNLKNAILGALREGIPFIQSPTIFMSALWILATYCEADGALDVLKLVKNSLGELPLVDSELSGQEEQKPEEQQPEQQQKQKPKVTADGTYATQTALSSTVTTSKKNEKPPLRRFLLDGEFFLGASLATVLTKLAQQFTELNGAASERANRFRAECMLILSSIIHLAKSGLCIVHQQVNEDDLDRMGATIKILAQGIPGLDEQYGDDCKKSLELMLGAKSISRLDVTTEKMASTTAAGYRSKDFVEIDKTINFTQLSARSNQQGENLFDLSLSQALGTAPKAQKFDFSSSKLGKVIQLAGFSDPIYAEAYVNVNQYDIVLDVLIVNQTSDTLQNVSLELATVGDLKLVDKPTPVTLAPNDFSNIKATVKVASTENGVIFSTISYDVTGSTSDRNCVYLQDIKIDIMDYIVPGNVTDTEFRTMWSDFEWENKVNVMTPIRDLRDFLNHLSTSTNMKVLTGDAAIEGDCGFLAANLCAHSIFGEDALANVSVEKALPMDDSSPIVGHIRIRAKSQGMCLTLGDKLSSAMRSRRDGQPIAAPSA